MALSNPTISVLGQDPGNRRRCNINANAFQQDAVVTFQGWQYVVFYSYLSSNDHGQTPDDKGGDEPLYIHLARRDLRITGTGPNGHTEEKKRVSEWEIIVFVDYPQTIDDGHNTVQMGICPGDGTIHLAYDHHCDVLRYRHSVPNLAFSPTNFKWSSSLFSPTLSHLPGISPFHIPFKDVTYPRFGFLGHSSMFLSFRDGRAGLGNDHLYVYTPSASVSASASTNTNNPSTYHSSSLVQDLKDPTSAPSPAPAPSISSGVGKFTYKGQHLTGLNSNPYINGITYSPKEHKIHITWVYRGFVHYPGWDDPLDTKHKQQSGPNGAENNHDLCYAFSADGGDTWRNGNGEVIADLRTGTTNTTTTEKEEENVTETGTGKEKSMPNTITNNAPGIVAFKIPKGSGLMNQEAQAVDDDGRVHVLNRDSYTGASDDKEGSDNTKQVRWKHYFRDPLSGQWTSHTLPIIPGPKRGRLATTTRTSPQNQANHPNPPNPPTQTEIYIILPGSNTDSDSTFRILKASSKDNFTTYTKVWSSQQNGPRLSLTGEPLVDSSRLEFDNVLSVFCLREYDHDHDREEAEDASDLDKRSGRQKAARRDVVLLDFELPP